MTRSPLPTNSPMPAELTAAQPAIRIVGPNPALDRVEVLDELRLDTVNRSAKVLSLAGGKSLIVARAIRRLGGRATVYGFLGGWVGQFIRETCASLSLDDKHIEIGEETRITSVLVEPHRGRSTVINEPGPLVTAEQGETLLAKLAEDCKPGDLVVCTGSLPRGLPVSFHADAVQRVQARGARAAVDSSGLPLAAAVEHRPWLVKPNLAEFRELTGLPLAPDRPGDLIAAMRALIDRGVRQVILTLGADGLLFADGEQTLQVLPPRIAVRNPTGSGDTFLAGFVMAQAQGADVLTALRAGTAAAAVNASKIVPDIEGSEEAEMLLGEIQIDQLEDRAAPAVNAP